MSSAWATFRGTTPRRAASLRSSLVVTLAKSNVDLRSKPLQLFAAGAASQAHAMPPDLAGRIAEAWLHFRAGALKAGVGPPACVGALLAEPRSSCGVSAPAAHLSKPPSSPARPRLALQVRCLVPSSLVRSCRIWTPRSFARAISCAFRMLAKSGAGLHP